ncbi:MAG: tRNA epoxyqueuosine(34) reductase QueG [Vicinamibacteria bacterium]|nr:tRNA epoxyqueuosine(34) reductase QueG [Vicinamibacteria bacterium]
MNRESRSERVKAVALETGFDLVGIAGPEPPPALAFFADWVARGHAGEMEYLTKQPDRRQALHRIFPWARSIVCVGLQYDTPRPYSIAAPARQGWLSRYAWGDDYHEIMMKMLRAFAARLLREAGPFAYRAYVDTGPLVERAWAAAAGLGAWGKNTCLIHPEHGSWFFLGELITDLDLSCDSPRADLCGSCRACLDACPTGALRAPYVLDATRCISYLTIELKGTIPSELRASLGRHVFGCDVCQDVCPWNRRRRRAGGSAFEPRDGLCSPALHDLAAVDDDAFRRLFRHSAVKRTRRRGLLRNVAVALGNTGGDRAMAAAEHLSRDPEALVREHARWALSMLRSPPNAESESAVESRQARELKGK